MSVLLCFVLLYMTRFKVRGDKLLKPVWGFFAPISIRETITGESLFLHCSYNEFICSFMLRLTSMLTFLPFED